ncbi:MAG: tagaturonate epimerase family protein, partial [Negativicutes bacterium]|nr:tagaturonate epimerase family protein [Negativicutes bacterium]
MLTTLALLPSFGFGDRLGLATAGHIAAVKDTKFAPI